MEGQYLRELVENELRPTIIDRVSEELVFFGFALDSCKGADDHKWLIQIYFKEESDESGVEGQTIEYTGFVNGKRTFSSAWSERYNYAYKQGENFEESIPWAMPNSN